jgi:hypothetical protein
VGTKWADDNRYGLCNFNTFLVFVGLILSIVAACGLSTDAGVMENTYWMSYKTVIEKGMNCTLTNPETTEKMNVQVLSYSEKNGNHYANLWGVYHTCDEVNLNFKGPTGIMAYNVAHCPINGDKTKSWGTIKDDANNLEHSCDKSMDVAPCADSAKAFEFGVIVGCITTFLTLIQAPARSIRANDIDKKCMSCVTAIIPILTSIVTVLEYSKFCIDEVSSEADPQMGPGFILYLIALFIANVPAFFIHLAIPAPQMVDPEGADQTLLQQGTETKSTA